MNQTWCQIFPKIFLLRGHTCSTWSSHCCNNNNFYYSHQPHYEQSDWSRAFNQYTIACELDMINALSAADIAFIMSSSTSAWLLSPLECSPQKQNGWTLRFCFWGWIMWKMYNKTIIEFGFAWYHNLSKPHVCVICLSPWLRQITQTSVLIIHDIMLNLIQKLFNSGSL